METPDGPFFLLFSIIKQIPQIPAASFRISSTSHRGFHPDFWGPQKCFFLFFLELRRYGNTLDLFSRSDRAGPVLVEVTFHHAAPFLAALLRLHRGWARRRRRRSPDSCFSGMSASLVQGGRLTNGLTLDIFPPLRDAHTHTHTYKHRHIHTHECDVAGWRMSWKITVARLHFSLSSFCSAPSLARPHTPASSIISFLSV